MSGKTIILLLMLIGLGGYYQYNASHAKSGKISSAQAAATAPVQSQVMSSADQTYLTNAMQNAGTNYRAWREGVTVQNISLPSGKAMKMTVTKTKTGWCPKRRENLYQMSIGVSQ